MKLLTFLLAPPGAVSMDGRIVVEKKQWEKAPQTLWNTLRNRNGSLTVNPDDCGDPFTFPLVSTTGYHSCFWEKILVCIEWIWFRYSCFPIFSSSTWEHCCTWCCVHTVPAEQKKTGKPPHYSNLDIYPCSDAYLKQFLNNWNQTQTVCGCFQLNWIECISVNIGICLDVTASSVGFAAMLAPVSWTFCSSFHRVGEIFTVIPDISDSDL